MSLMKNLFGWDLDPSEPESIVINKAVQNARERQLKSSSSPIDYGRISNQDQSLLEYDDKVKIQKLQDLVMQFSPASITKVSGANLIDNIKALSSLQKFSDEKGYGLKNIIHYAKDQSKTDAVIKEIMNRNRTFTRGVVASNKNEAVKYLTTIPPKTNGGRWHIEANEDALYMSNSNDLSNLYTHGQGGYVGKLKLPTDFSSSNRIDWITANKKIPDNVSIIDNSPIRTNLNDVELSNVNNVIRKLNYSKTLMSLATHDDKFKLFAKQKGIQGGDLSSNDVDRISRLINRSRKIKGETDIAGNDIFNNMGNKYIADKSGMPFDYETLKDMQPLNVIDTSKPFKEYIIKGTPGENAVDLIDLKAIKPFDLKSAQFKHQGSYSTGLSLAGMFGLSTTNQDSMKNLFGGNR